MTIRYVPIKDTKNGSDGEACDFNCNILMEGVQGQSCWDVRQPTQGEVMDYLPFAPWDCHFSCVELYSNGAKNFFVRSNKENKVVGYILIRPLNR